MRKLKIYRHVEEQIIKDSPPCVRRHACVHVRVCVCNQYKKSFMWKSHNLCGILMCMALVAFEHSCESSIVLRNGTFLCIFPCKGGTAAVWVDMSILQCHMCCTRNTPLCCERVHNRRWMRGRACECMSACEWHAVTVIVIVSNVVELMLCHNQQYVLLC